jgi:hypothetical protein
MTGFAGMTLAQQPPTSGGEGHTTVGGYNCGFDSNTVADAGVNDPAQVNSASTTTPFRRCSS